MYIISAFIIGLVGSLHCIGMCGPIVLALPSNEFSKIKIISTRLLYNFGRVITYSLLGLIFGIIGSRIEVFGLQQISSIGLGIVMIFYVLIPKRVVDLAINIKLVNSISRLLKNSFRKLLNKTSYSSFFLIGVLNGFLPCGFVYVGIAGALIAGSLIDSAIYMFLFGIGTIPVMFLTSLIPSFMGVKNRLRVQKIIPILIVVLGIIFILRGLNLGIPMLSPKDSKVLKNKTQTVSYNFGFKNLHI